MHRIFITGGTGYIGRPLIRQLLAREHLVRALARPGSEHKLPAGCTLVLGDAVAGGYAGAVEGADTFIHLVGVSRPSPAKAMDFRTIDLPSVREAVTSAVSAGVGHFVYLSVARPAPVMKAYIAVRSEGEELVRSSGLNATLVRPWYVLGPGHRWPLALKPAYWVAERLPGTRPSALRLGLITLEEMVDALVKAVENPCQGIRTLEVPEIRARAFAAETC